ncbi:hypothetical protein LP420_37665 [Massilia sp. B-10]|nr:hypothetical protein LP420_37665 [Massilia sp. B-10]
MFLEEATEQQQRVEEERGAAQAQVNAETTANAQLEARLSALKQLQERTQTQGKVTPWLQKHELDSLPRLWQKLHIEQGWETALESILRERTTALEMSNIDWAKAFFNDAPYMSWPCIRHRWRTWPRRWTMLRPHAVRQPAQAKRAGPARPLARLAAQCVRCRRRAVGAGRSRPPAAGRLLHHAPGPRGHRVRACVSTPPTPSRMACWDASRKSKTSRASCAPKPCWPTRRAPAGARRCVRIRTDAPPAGHARPRGHADPVGARAADRGRQAVRSRSASTSAARRFWPTWPRSRPRKPSKSRSRPNPKKNSNSSTSRGRTAGRPRRRTDRVPQQGTGAGRRAKNCANSNARPRKRSSLKNPSAARSRNCAAISPPRPSRRPRSAKASKWASRNSTRWRRAPPTTACRICSTAVPARNALSDARHELDQITQQLRTAEESRMQAERSLQPQRDKITEMQLKEQAARLNQEQFAEALKAVDADEAALSEKLHADMKPQYLQGEVTRLTNAIAALGAVNLAALDELAQASERKNFLDAQNKDLVEAITTLEDAISRIDKETRELLQDTFDRVNHHFSELFPILFGGGNAKLVMTGDEILDSGVQVMAQPPGKKNATIHLLSGGEKALTATALVFSMFRLNPAPFCLLDEVDAPLDDANTERFCRMVKRMSDHTQFLFISHNKIAMEMANQLIGVTMQEQGVSRIVAVDMESAANFATEAQAA